ncbi:hypothetical protein BU16DRAFT_567460 [Lophium mytilinum]|uniref:ACB domain-containing protein n=1 Tax=Lophium mytilinum TaxID=390894 RepID=A0A6A6QB23_9PEZI|nr:hypothetical protein BU16DRAFT_567460 [Lophium mytilinum]
MARTPGPAFEKAYKKATYLQNASNDDMLDLYAYAVIARAEKDLASTPKPGMFDLAGKAKRNKWEKYVNEGVKPADAEKAYVAKVDELVSKHGLKDTVPAELK